MPVTHALPDPATCEQARLSRDARFDGRLFVGVTSTGVYCRPSCRSRTANPKNVRIHDTLEDARATAEVYAACLRLVRPPGG